MKNGIMGCVSFIFFRLLQIIQLQLKFYTLKIFAYFTSINSALDGIKQTFQLMKHFKYIYPLLIKETKKKKKLLLSFNHHQGCLSNSFSQIVKISFPIIHNSLKVC